MRKAVVGIVIAGLIGAVAVALRGRESPGGHQSTLWEMRKKTQQRGASRAGSYLDEMNRALASGYGTDAERALSAAIAQGTMTQPQIEEARGRIAALAGSPRSPAAAASVAQSREASSPSSGNSSGSATAGSSQAVVVRFESSGMLWVQSGKIFNLSESGEPRSSSTDVSPGEMTKNSFDYGSKSNTHYENLYLYPGRNKTTVGRYGFKVVWTHLTTPDLTPTGFLAGEGRGADKRLETEGTFDIRSGVSQVTISYDPDSPKVKVTVW